MKTHSLALLIALVGSAHADLKLPSIFSDHMVLQRDKEVRIWGWDDPGQSVSLSFAGQTVSATADAEGKWTASLKPLSTMKTGQTLTAEGSTKITLNDILVGEVWLCSGQSNMGWPVSASNDPDLESMTANYPQIRLITLPKVGTQTPLDDFKGSWQLCSPSTVPEFSAVGYFFGRTLHQALDVPIGLIDNAWGGSSAEAWVRRDRLEADPAFKPYLDQWAKTEANFDFDAVMAKFEKRAAAAKKDGKPKPQAPRNVLIGQHRPANLYNGMIHPILGFTLQGCIWYQGESNASRAANYAELFPLMINSWREDWQQGDFSFYWAQLADFNNEQTDPNAPTTWAELRESQTSTLSLPNTGEAIITDLGEAHDIHPRDKQNVAKRLARHALAKNYGKQIVHESPRYDSHETRGNKMILKFSHPGGGMDTHDVREPHGFVIASETGDFVPAKAKIIGKDSIEVWADSITSPTRVRYAWADNPVANVQNREGLPLTPFRTKAD